jgi:hypothetical protein
MTFVTSISNILRQREVRRKKLPWNITPHLPFLAKKTVRSLMCVDWENVSTDESTMKWDEANSLVTLELQKEQPDIPLILTLNRHLYVPNANFDSLPPRLSISIHAVR